MKKMLPMICALVLLSSCTLTGRVAEALQQDPASLSYDAAFVGPAGAFPAVVLTNPGPTALEDIAAYVFGAGLRMDDPRCAPYKAGWACKLRALDRGAKAAFRVQAARPTSGSATFYRAGGNRVVWLPLK